MIISDKPRFAALHKRLTDAHHNIRGDEGYMEACMIALMPFPLAVMEAVYREAVASPRFGSFAPKPAELVALAQEIGSLAGMKSAEQWAYEWLAFIRARIHQLRGPDSAETRLKSRYDAQAVQAVADCGGLARVLKGDDEAVERRFVKAYCKLEPNYQDAPPRPLKEGEDPARPFSPVRGRIMKRPQQAAVIAANEAQAEIGYQSRSRDVTGLMRGLMRS